MEVDDELISIITDVEDDDLGTTTGYHNALPLEVLPNSTSCPTSCLLPPAQACYIRKRPKKLQRTAFAVLKARSGSVQMSENSRLEIIKVVAKFKSNKPAKVKSTFEAKKFFEKIVKVKSHDEHT